jgi:hypothetical protein
VITTLLLTIYGHNKSAESLLKDLCDCGIPVPDMEVKGTRDEIIARIAQSFTSLATATVFIDALTDEQCLLRVEPNKTVIFP